MAKVHCCSVCGEIGRIDHGSGWSYFKCACCKCQTLCNMFGTHFIVDGVDFRINHRQTKEERDSVIDACEIAKEKVKLKYCKRIKWQEMGF